MTPHVLPRPGAVAWVRPTARAVPWTPLGVTAGAVLPALALARSQDGPAGSLTALVAAAIAAAFVAGLTDPAAALLAAAPTTPLRRTLHRIALLAPPALALWAVTALVAGTDRAAGSPGPLVALAAAGAAVALHVPRHGAALGIALPVVWFGAAWAIGTQDGPVAALATLPQDHPWPLALLAAVAVTAGRTRLEYPR